MPHERVPNAECASDAAGEFPPVEPRRVLGVRRVADGVCKPGMGVVLPDLIHHLLYERQLILTEHLAAELIDGHATPFTLAFAILVG